MSDKGIIFSAPMVRALLDGRKTQTRRLLKPQPPSVEAVRELSGSGYHWFARRPSDREWTVAGPVWAVRQITGARLPKIKVPYAPGDRLYVREAFSYDMLDVDRDGTLPPWYWADGNIADAEQGSGNFTKPKPSIHMPRWASRLTLTVTDVRVQRVAEISEADARAEGLIPWSEGVCHPTRYSIINDPAETWETARDAFAGLWSQLHDKPGEHWEDNPWIVAVSFDVKHGNIDRIGP